MNNIFCKKNIHDIIQILKFIILYENMPFFKMFIFLNNSLTDIHM